MIRAHYGNFKKSTMNITICRVFCLMLNCDKWRPCFKANKHCFNHIMLDHMIWKGINVRPNKQNQTRSAREIACELTNLIQAHKNIILPFLIQFLHDSFQNMPVCQTFWYITLSTWNILVTLCQFSKTLRKRFLINKLNGTLFRFSAFKSFLKFDCIQEALLHRGTTSLIGFITLWNYMEFIDMVTNSTGRIQREVLTTLLILSSWIKKFLGQQSNIWDDSSVEKLFR